MIEVTSLAFRHGSEAPLFEKLSFSLARGQTLVLLGRNGRGKTTLLKCMAGVLTPTQGTISCGGAAGHVPQSFSTPFDYSARDIVLTARARHISLFSKPGSKDHAHVDAAIERVGIGHLAGRAIATLSGGERQLALIARAIASEAEILLLDEPAASLDFHNQAAMLAMLARLSEERGLTVVMTTHEPAHAVEIADRVLLLHGGAHYEEGPVSEICTEEKLTALYGLPMKRLDFEWQGGPAQTIVAHYGAA